MINKILVETNGSFSNVFITLNSFLKGKNTSFYYVDSFFGRISRCPNRSPCQHCERHSDRFACFFF